MSSGSSNIDPIEFNESNVGGGDARTDGQNGGQEASSSEVPRSTSRSGRSRTGNGNDRRGRRLRQHVSPPANGSLYRIWVYQPLHEPYPGRHTLNRIIFSIARALRTRRSVPAQPGQRPGVIFRRTADLITIDVEREYSSNGSSD